MTVKETAHDLGAALRILHILDSGGQFSPDNPRHADRGLKAQADKVIALCADLAEVVRSEYPHSGDN